jgi:hypothetical protein
MVEQAASVCVRGETMTLLALDASTTAVGWSLFDDAEYLESGVFVPKGGDWVERVYNIEGWLYDNGLEYDDMAFELATGNRGNMATNRKLGAVEYVIRYFCKAHEIELITVTASQVKATGCHKGAQWGALATKGRALDTGHPGDEADAIGVGLACWKKMKEEALKSM